MTSEHFLGLMLNLYTALYFIATGIYTVFSVQANWYKAEQYCRFHGMHLASINKEEEQKDLEEHIESFGNKDIRYTVLPIKKMLLFMKFRKIQSEMFVNNNNFLHGFSL